MDTTTSPIVPTPTTAVTAEGIVDAAQGIVDGASKVLSDPYAFGVRIGTKAAKRALEAAVLGERANALTLDAIVRRASETLVRAGRSDH